jgi:hypothetical protein
MPNYLAMMSDFLTPGVRFFGALVSNFLVNNAPNNLAQCKANFAIPTFIVKQNLHPLAP